MTLAETIDDMIDREQRLLAETRATVERWEAQLVALDEEAAREGVGGHWGRGAAWKDRRHARINRRTTIEAEIRTWRATLERETIERNGAIRALRDVARRCA